MKFRLLAAIALSSIMTVSISFAEPAFQTTDDNVGASPSAPPSSDNNAMGSMQNPNSNDPTSLPTSPSSPSNSSDNSNTNDDMSADTATGDDDY